MRLLELTAPASADDIRRAYRTLARRMHPDRHPGDDQARRHFIILASAYRTLMRQSRRIDPGWRLGECGRCGQVGEVVLDHDRRPSCLSCVARRMSARDCMTLLGLRDPVAVEDVKHAYRRLALRMHPDKHRGDEDARRRFVLISNAYRILMRSARAVHQGRSVGECSACGEFGEVMIGLNGRPRCPRCIFRPEGGHLLPMPPLVVVKCVGAIVLLTVTLYLLGGAMFVESDRLAGRYAVGALIAGLLTLAALAVTSISIVHCVTPHERYRQASYRTAEDIARASIGSKSAKPD
ncbi:MAG TPA: DnaJ domain-containing protein [Phycisphaerae bacterium]|nr:DnaJ domain-containing protein [Phycisphaerae bacterium]HRY67168.1 DnaJ domain-containing protein [Phycisphaerae bacterium]HSA26463.1 DnaJ domain-containing protein [Phycisphaerae bacterium]